MALTGIQIYKLLPQTNCKECDFPTCLAFASAVVLDRFPLEKCPHIQPGPLSQAQAVLAEQHQDGKFLKKDLAKDALDWAKKRSASMELADIAERIGGRLETGPDQEFVELPYFNSSIRIYKHEITSSEGIALDRWEQVFIYNHIAQGGRALPTGSWKALEQIPNTTSKIVSMRDHVEAPLIEHFSGHVPGLIEAVAKLGGQLLDSHESGCDAAFYLKPFPKIPLLLLFWDAEKSEGFDAQVKLLFDETITEHLDIESIMFLSEKVRKSLCE